MTVKIEFLGTADDVLKEMRILLAKHETTSIALRPLPTPSSPPAPSPTAPETSLESAPPVASEALSSAKDFDTVTGEAPARRKPGGRKPKTETAPAHEGSVPASQPAVDSNTGSAPAVQTPAAEGVSTSAAPVNDLSTGAAPSITWQQMHDKVKEVSEKKNLKAAAAIIAEFGYQKIGLTAESSKVAPEHFATIYARCEKELAA